jgi:hypothetical protein
MTKFVPYIRNHKNICSCAAFRAGKPWDLVTGALGMSRAFGATVHYFAAAHFCWRCLRIRCHGAALEREQRQAPQPIRHERHRIRVGEQGTRREPGRRARSHAHRQRRDGTAAGHGRVRVGTSRDAPALNSADLVNIYSRSACLRLVSDSVYSLQSVLVQTFNPPTISQSMSF